MTLSARNITVRHGARIVLDAVSLALAPGELVGLIGPNGAGKTTLAHALAGLGDAIHDVTLDGAPLSAISRERRAKRIAYLAQDGEMHWPMTARAVVALGRLPHRVPSTPAEDDRAVRAAMVAADVASFADRPLDTLSGGERARVLLARALAVEANYLLADEPVAALDPQHRLKVMAALRSTARKGTACLVVLHDLSLAARYCDRLVLLGDGRVIADGMPSDVLTPMHLRRAYGVEMMSGTIAGVPYVLPTAAAEEEGWSNR